jgi:hypothetical protein
LAKAASLLTFDQPIFANAAEGEVNFTGWCFHPTRELTNLSLCVNGESFPARFRSRPG